MEKASLCDECDASCFGTTHSADCDCQAEHRPLPKLTSERVREIQREGEEGYYSDPTGNDLASLCRGWLAREEVVEAARKWARWDDLGDAHHEVYGVKIALRALDSGEHTSPTKP